MQTVRTDLAPQTIVDYHSFVCVHIYLTQSTKLQEANSVHRGGGLCMMSLPVWLPVPCSFWGGVFVLGFSVQGHLCQGGPLSRGLYAGPSLSRGVRWRLTTETPYRGLHPITHNPTPHLLKQTETYMIRTETYTLVLISRGSQ